MMRRFLLAAAVVGTAAGVLAREKIVLGHGWDTLDATPEDMLANAEAFDRTPFDGFTITLRNGKRPDGTKIDCLKMRGDAAWTPECFYGYDRTMRELVKHRSMKESMLVVYWGTGDRLAWQDDEKWTAFAQSMSAVATLAKRWNLPGIVIDPEDYNRKNQYTRFKDDGDWAELKRLARKRGRQMSEAIFTAYPKCRLLAFWTFSNIEPTWFQDPEKIVRSYYDLRPDFFNGLMDGLSAEGTIHDGDEMAYLARADRNDFHFHAWRTKEGGRSMVATENMSKYDRQWRVSFGLYPDAHVRPLDRGWRFHREFDDLAPNALFSMNVEQALKAADDMIWIYWEKGTLIRWKEKKFDCYAKNGLWDEQIPGFSSSVRYAKDVRGALAADIASGAVKACADESQLKDEKGEGGLYKYLVVDGVQGGETYGVRFKTKAKNPRVWVFWHADGKFKRDIWPVDIGVDEKPGADGRYEGAAVVRVPDRDGVEMRDNVTGIEVRLYADFEATDLPEEVELKVYPILKAFRAKAEPGKDAKK